MSYIDFFLDKRIIWVYSIDIGMILRAADTIVGWDSIDCPLPPRQRLIVSAFFACCCL